MVIASRFFHWRTSPFLRSLAIFAALCWPVGAPAQDWPDLSTPAPAVGGGDEDAAVVVGIEGYAFVGPVPGAEANAKLWNRYLADTRGVPPQNIKLLTGVDGTRGEILAAVAKAGKRAGPQGTLWFVFIGHGAPSSDGKDGLLLGVDAQQKPESLEERGVRRSEILKALAASRAGAIRVVLDACFSGKRPDGSNLAPGLQPLLTVAAAGPADPRTVVLTAAKGDQFAGPLPGASRPAFSYLLLGGLRGWAVDGRKAMVTAGDLLRYATNALDATLRGRNQTPDLLGQDGAAVAPSPGEKGPNLSRLAEATAGASAKEEMFRVSNLPAVPRAQAPKVLDAKTSSLDFGTVDVDALEKYDAAMEYEKGDAAAEDKAATWRSLAEQSPQFATIARKRAEEWERYAAEWKAGEEARAKRREARDADWKKLSRLLALKVVAEADKRKWSAQFVEAYLPSPGLEPETASELAKYTPDGPSRKSLLALARSAPATKTSAGPKAAAGPRPWLGIEITTLEQTTATRLGLSSTEGARVKSVIAGSPAQKAGLRADDVVLQFDGAPVRGPDEVVSGVRKSKVGATSKLMIQREGKHVEVFVRWAAASSAWPGATSVEWVSIPGGSFMMGSNANKDEMPIHRVTVKPFQMAKTEVTNKQYRACVEAGACTPAHVSDGNCSVYGGGSSWTSGPPLPASFQGDDQPVVCVDWEQAKAFAQWVGGRLPTEAEWEYAARSAGKDWKYPWGNEDATCARVVMDHGGNGCGRNATWPVCSKTAGNTEQGLCDMAGNVWEWTQDWHHDSYHGAPADGSPWESPTGSLRVHRGGSWYYSAGGLRAAIRFREGPTFRNDHIGVRVAR